MARVIVADKAGACYGVERALKLARKAVAEAAGPVRTLGPLIHNPAVVDELARAGVVAVDSPGEAEPGSVLIMRAHGVTPEVERQAAEAGLATVDATCPFVKKVHVAAERLAREGYQVVIVGEAGHPEVEGTRGHAPEALVVGSAEEAAALEHMRKVGIVAQTTLERAVLRGVVAELVGRCDELRLLDTICEATSERQQAAGELAATADVMVVVGGRGSANTRHLADVCRAHCEKTHHIEGADELEAAWTRGAGVIGVTAGASTPADQIEEVVVRIESLVG